MRALSRIGDGWLATHLLGSIRIVSFLGLSLVIVPRWPSEWVIKVYGRLIVVVFGTMPGLQLPIIVLLKQVLSHVLENFLILRDVLMNIFNLVRLDWLLLDFRDFYATSFLFILLFVMLTQNLNLRRYRIVADIALIRIIFLIFSEQVLKIPVTNIIRRRLWDLRVLCG
jgi:hypothetical protein